MNKKILLTLVFFACLTAWMRCSKSTEPKESFGSIQGTVQSAGAVLYPAYLVAGDSLLATTDREGHYAVASIPAGALALTCSALNYGDTTVQVQIKGDETASVDFNLTKDETKGLIFGEFEHAGIWADTLKQNASKGAWTAKEQFDAETGATMCFKIVQEDLGDRSVFLGDSLITIADAWGQFWFRLPRGVYPLKGNCNGYRDDVRIVKVLPTPPDTTYASFFLSKNANAKAAK